MEAGRRREREHRTRGPSGQGAAAPVEHQPNTPPGRSHVRKGARGEGSSRPPVNEDPRAGVAFQKGGVLDGVYMLWAEPLRLFHRRS